MQTDKNDLIVKEVESTGVLPVINIPHSDLAEDVACAVIKGGINSMEITLRSADSLQSISKVKKAYPNMVLGAGTVLSTQTVDDAINAGADYIVTPGYDQEIVDYCKDKNIMIIPGCSSPSEIQKALKSGLSVIKFFPAELSGGTKALKLLSGPFKKAKFLPTGGITLDNLGEYLKLPCVIACGGSFMAGSDLVSGKKFDEITALCKKSVEISLGFELAHVGINGENETQAINVATALSDVLGFSVKIGNSSVFAGKAVEVMKTKYYGTNGHIGFYTNSVKRALCWFEKNGMEVIKESVKEDSKGLVSAYLKQELGGFAIHVVRR